MTPGDFESLQKAELTANKIELLIREGIKVSTKEVYDFYVFQNQKVNLNFVRIAFANFEKKIVPSQQELEDFLKNNGNLFRVSEQIKIKYLFSQPTILHRTSATPISTITIVVIRKNS